MSTFLLSYFPTYFLISLFRWSQKVQIIWKLYFVMVSLTFVCLSKLLYQLNNNKNGAN